MHIADKIRACPRALAVILTTCIHALAAALFFAAAAFVTPVLAEDYPQLHCSQTKTARIEVISDVFYDFPTRLDCTLSGLRHIPGVRDKAFAHPWRLFFAKDARDDQLVTAGYYCLWYVLSDGTTEILCASPATHPRDWERLEADDDFFNDRVVYLDIPGLDRTLIYWCNLEYSAVLESHASYSCEPHPERGSYRNPVSESFRALRMER